MEGKQLLRNPSIAPTETIVLEGLDEACDT